MDILEQLVRRCMNETFPISLYTLMDVLRRFPQPAIYSGGISGVNEKLLEAVNNLIVENIYTIKHMPMDPVSEFQVVQCLSEALEDGKKDFLDLIIQPDNPNTHGMLCKIISFSISLRLCNTLRKCTRVIRSVDIAHPLKIALLTMIRSDFCQISQTNLTDLSALPKLSIDLTSIFLNTLCIQQSHLPDLKLFRLISEWLFTEQEILTALRLHTSHLIRWNLLSFNMSEIDNELRWKTHFSILNSIQSRPRSTKPTFMGASDAKTWVECLTDVPESSRATATDMVLQLIQVSKNTLALHLSQEDLDWCLTHLHKTEFHNLLKATGNLNVG